MLIDVLKQRLIRLSETHQLRTRPLISQRHRNHIIIDNQPLINFCSNDYLGIATDNEIQKIFSHGIAEYGLGSGSSSQISGYSKSHQTLENQFAAFLQRDRAILFNSGYQANLAVITALANRQSSIVADKHCHASLIDGILLSRAKHNRYRHQDIGHCEIQLQKTQNALLITEGVFSIDGSISHLKSLSQLSKIYDATLLVDDAHGMGWLGYQGKGSCDYHQLTQQDVPCLILPLGKAFGSMGAIVAGDATFIEAILQMGRSYRYTTALPPAICEATAVALKIIQQDTSRREKLKQLIAFFIDEAEKRALPLLSKDITPIKAIATASEKVTEWIKAQLIQKGYLIAGMRPPTVPPHRCCLRISLNCFHTEHEVITLLDHIKNATNSLLPQSPVGEGKNLVCGFIQD